MKDNLILNIIIKAVVCFSKECKDPSIFPQHLITGRSVQVPSSPRLLASIYPHAASSSMKCGKKCGIWEAHTREILVFGVKFWKGLLVFLCLICHFVGAIDLCVEGQTLRARLLTQLPIHTSTRWRWQQMWSNQAKWVWTRKYWY